ncbi:hypothetical protein [uncultured Psychroserpens sp.]|uniref:hypothetical protein n=1 Tax=uncultured Psychroserpens sp. TaxID=255436 RepID=UPI00261EF9F5|nr:hypothetical protein [uncultured Psychroserpens sp.]
MADENSLHNILLENMQEIRDYVEEEFDVPSSSHDIHNQKLRISISISLKNAGSENEYRLKLHRYRRESSNIGYLNLNITDDLLNDIGFKHSTFILELSGLSLRNPTNAYINVVNEAGTNISFITSGHFVVDRITFNGNFDLVKVLNLSVTRMYFESGYFNEVELIKNNGKNSEGNLKINTNIGALKLSHCKSYSYEIENINLIESSIDNNQGSLFLIKGLTEVSSFSFNRNTIDYLVVSNIKTKDDGGKLMLTENTVNINAKFENLNFKERVSWLVRKTKLSIDFRSNKLIEFDFENVAWSYKALFSSKASSSVLFSILELKSIFSKSKETQNEKLFEAFEKRNYYDNNSFDLSLFLSYWSNKFGLSLRRPFLWILIFTTLEVFLIIILSGECRSVFFDNWGIFTHLFSPVHKTEVFFTLLKETCYEPKNFKNLIYVIDNVNRIILTYLIFQFVGAFRYKYNLK